jgi:hypothetical protein
MIAFFLLLLTHLSPLHTQPTPPCVLELDSKKGLHELVPNELPNIPGGE